MKKIIPLILLFLGAVGVAIFVSVNNAKTDENIKKEWIIKNPKIEQIKLDGNQQPLKIKILETENEETKVSLSGKVANSTINALEKAELSNSKLFIPFSEKGFKLAVYSDGKDTLDVTIELGKNANVEELLVDVLSGKIDMVVPKTFEGKYDVKVNGGAKLLNVPETKGTTNSVVKIITFDDVNITRES